MPENRIYVHVFLLALIAGVAAPGLAQEHPPLAQVAEGPAVADPEIPDRLASRYVPEGPPFWLSARAATGPNGDFRWELLDPSDRQMFQSYIERGSYEEIGCIGIERIFTSPLNPPPHHTLEDLVDHSVTIVSGTVVGRKPGFLNGTPGYLLRLKVLDTFKTSAQIGPRDFIYFFYPKGEFEAGGYRFCVVQPELPAVPWLGDRLLIMPLYPPLDESQSILRVRFDQIFIEKASGRFAVARRWESQAAEHKLRAITGPGAQDPRTAPDTR